MHFETIICGRVSRILLTVCHCNEYKCMYENHLVAALDFRCFFKAQIGLTILSILGL